MTSSKFKKTSLAADLFLGLVPDAFPFPAMSAEQTETATSLIQLIDKFAEENIDSAELDRTAHIPDELLQSLARLGFCGMNVPEEFGGLNLDPAVYARVFSQITGHDSAIATTLGTHQSIGLKALVNEGTAEQKAHWLPRLAAGELIAAFCLTEPGSGSDAYSITTKAVKAENNQYILNGQKLWITNAHMAGFYTVFAKTDEIQEGQVREKISCFIVEKDRPGVSFGAKELKMGICASETRSVYFDNVSLPATHMIGRPGDGFRIAMNVLNSGRLYLGAGSVGTMKTIVGLAARHANTRKQFNQPIAEFGMVQEKLAQMAASVYACESMVYMTTGKMNQGMEDFSLESAICKIYCTEKLWDSIDKATQIAAGAAYMKDYPYERLMRDCRISLIFEGTNEILRVYTALAGLRGPGERLKTLKSSPLRGGLNLLQSRLNRKLLSLPAHTRLQKEAKEFTKSLASFATCTENVLIKNGKSVAQNQLLQLRLANMAIELFAQLCVLSRTTAILNSADVTDQEKTRALKLAQLVCARSLIVFEEQKSLLGSPHDHLLPEISRDLCQQEGYTFDITRF